MKCNKIFDYEKPFHYRTGWEISGSCNQDPNTGIIMIFTKNETVYYSPCGHFLDSHIDRSLDLINKDSPQVLLESLKKAKLYLDEAIKNIENNP